MALVPQKPLFSFVSAQTSTVDLQQSIHIFLLIKFNIHNMEFLKHASSTYSVTSLLHQIGKIRGKIKVETMMHNVGQQSWGTQKKTLITENEF